MRSFLKGNIEFGHFDPRPLRLVSCCVSRFVSGPSLIQRSYERLELNDLFIRSYTSNFLLVIVRILHIFFLNVTCQWSRSYCSLLESKKVVGNFESMKPLMMHSCIVLLSSIICSTLTLMNNPGYYLSEAEDIHHRFIPILHGYPSEQKEHSLEAQKLSRAWQKSIPVGSPTNVGALGMIFVELLVMDADAQYDSNSETIEQTCIECLQHVHIFWNINTLVRKTIFQDKTCAAVVCWGSRSFCAREEGLKKMHASSAN